MTSIQKRLAQSTKKNIEEEIQSQFVQEGSLNQEEVCLFAPLSNTIHQSRERFFKFVEQLGPYRIKAIELEPYRADFPDSKIERSVDLNSIKEILENTLRKMSTNPNRKYKKNWSKDDLILFLWILEQYSNQQDKCVQEYNQNDWKFISDLVPGKDQSQCMFKWLGLKKHRNQEKFAWTESEDRILKSLVSQQSGTPWFEISKQLYLQNQGFKVYRNAKQCRERWACYLNPNLKKGLWSNEEDFILLSRYLEIGKKWSAIAKQLKGRTENAVKNRFNLILQKKQKIKTRISDEQFVKNHIQNLELNLFVETKDTLPPTVGFGDFSAQMDKFFNNSNQQPQLKQFQPCCLSDISEALSSCAEAEFNSQFSEEQRNTHFVTFKKANIKEMLQKMDSIYPAYYNQQQGEINYKEILPSIKKQSILNEQNVLFNNASSQFLEIDQENLYGDLKSDFFEDME